MYKLYKRFEPQIIILGMSSTNSTNQTDVESVQAHPSIREQISNALFDRAVELSYGILQAQKKARKMAFMEKETLRFLVLVDGITEQEEAEASQVLSG